MPAARIPAILDGASDLPEIPLSDATSSADRPAEPTLFRFGRFEADLLAGTLSREGIPVRLQPQPFKVLALLLRRAGQLVTRDEIRREVWGDDTFVNFDQGLAYCLNQIRGALGEAAQSGQYVQTLPRRGYRFVAPVHVGGAPLPVAAPEAAAVPAPSRGRRLALLAASAAAAALFAIVLVRTLPVPASGGARTLLVVLPFEELGPEASADHLGDGMTEELITEIGRISPGRLGVIARVSSMRYKGTRPELEQLGRELGVGHVLEGTVRSAGAHVRVTARLVRVADRAQIWARTYDRELDDVLALQAQVADDVARSVQGTLTAGEPARPRPGPVDPEVYRLLVQARYFWHQRTEATYRKALAAYQQAAERDPRSAPAWAGMAQSWIALAGAQDISPDEAYAQAQNAVARALELDPELGEAWAVRAAIDSIATYDWTAAERGYQRALALNPSDAVAHQWYSTMLCIQGRADEALAEARRAFASDPASPIMATHLAAMLIISGRNQEALAQSLAAQELDPESGRAQLMKGEALLQLGRPLEALQAFDESLARRPQLRPRINIFQARALAAAGRPQEGTRLLTALLGDEAWRDGRYDHYSVAAVLGEVGRRDDAFAALHRSLDAKESGIRFVLHDPALDRLLDDRRMDEIARRLRLRG